MKGQMPEKKWKHLNSEINEGYPFQNTQKLKENKSTEGNNCLRGRKYIYQSGNQKKSLKNAEDKESKATRMQTEFSNILNCGKFCNK